MPSSPPSFSSQSYWDDRFRTEGAHGKSHDWLREKDIFDPYILKALATESGEQGSSVRDSRPEQAQKPIILHIGSGTSLLSFHLGELLGGTAAVLNVDFSGEAVRWGEARERALSPRLGEVGGRKLGSGRRMCWRQADLMELDSLLAACEAASISLIVDKSTTDAVACGTSFTIRGAAAGPGSPAREARIHPVCVLATHLAVVAKPGAHWLALSYSDDRFPFLSKRTEQAVDEGLPMGLARVETYWRLLEKREIQTDQKGAPGGSGAVVYRPTISHYLYHLQRTEVIFDLQAWRGLQATTEGV